MTSPPRRLALWFLSLLALIGLVLLATGVLTWFLMSPPKLTAKTQINVPAVAPSILNNVEDNRGNGAFMQTQMDLVRSPSVLRAVLRDKEVANLSMIKQLEGDPVQLLEEKVQVEVMGLESFRICISGDNRDELLTLVKAVARAYMAEVVGTAPQKRREVLTRLMAVKQKLEEKLNNQRKLLKPVEEALGPANPENMVAQQKIALDKLKADQNEYIQVRSERRKLQVELGLPEKGGRSWESFAAALSILPAPVPPVNFALAVAFYDQPTVLLLPFGPPPARAGNDEQAKRVELIRRYTTLRALEEVLLTEVVQLDEFLQQFKKKAVDVGRLDAEFKKLKKFLDQAENRIQAIEVEEEAPPRVAWVGQGSPGADGQTQEDGAAWIVAPNAKKSRLIATAVQVGLGGLLLILAWVGFRARRMSIAEELPSEDLLPDEPSATSPGLVT